MGLMRRFTGSPNRFGIVQTRVGVCVVALVIAALPGIFEDPRWVVSVLVVYLVATMLFARVWSAKQLARKRVRAVPLGFDVIAIAMLEASGSGIERSLYILYLFPVLSAARYLGSRGSVLIAALAAAAHGIAGYAVTDGEPAFPPYLLHTLAFVGIAATAANLARARRSKEAKLVAAIARIDRQIFGDSKPEVVMQSILATAMEVTASDSSAMILLQDGETTERSAATRGDDAAEAARLVRSHHQDVLRTRRPLSLPAGAWAAAAGLLQPRRDADHWSGRLIPLLEQEPPGGVVGVLGVFCRGSLHYTPDDLQTLTVMAPLVTLAQKKAQRYPQLTSRERYFEKLVYDSPEPIIVIDARGRIQNFNHACERIWGWSEDQVRGESVKNYYDSPEEAQAVGDELRLEGTIRDRETRIKDSSGDSIPILLSATRFEDNEGRGVGSIGVFKDERMIRAERLAAFGRLAHAASHDFKTQIGIIHNWVGSLEGLAEGNKAILGACAKIRGATAAALKKLQQQLTLTPQPPMLKVVPLQPFLRDVEPGLRELAATAGVGFVAEIPSTDVALRADREALKQALTNLLANSVDAIAAAQPPRPGRIRLEAAVDDAVVRIQWCDNGVGMSEAAKRNAFVPFYTTKSVGTGLGLFQTREIIDNHAGRISVESSGEDGTCFRIILPCHPAGPVSPPSGLVS